MNSEFLDFVEGHSTGVTKVYLVKSKDGGHLGMIKWYSQWRKYCYFPQNNTLFDAGCLKEITKMLDKLMLDRKIAKQNSQQ